MAKKKEETKKKFIVDSYEAEELAAHICNCDSEDSEAIEEALYDKYGIDLYVFHRIASDISQTLSLGISPLTDTPFIGFSKVEGNHSCWIIKKDVSAEYIASVIQWIGGDKIKGKDKGFERIITSGGKPEYSIVIKKAVSEKKVKKVVANEDSK